MWIQSSGVGGSPGRNGTIINQFFLIGKDLASANGDADDDLYGILLTGDMSNGMLWSTSIFFLLLAAATQFLFFNY